MATRVFPVVVGVVLGGVVSVAVSHVFFSGEAKAGRASERSAATPDDGRDDLGALERRLDELGARVQSISTASVAAKPAPQAEAEAEGELDTTGQPARPPAPADVGAELQARAFEREQEHAAEAVDSTWAPKARQNFKDELGSLAGALGAEVSSVDCRTNVCKVELAWKAYDEATRHYHELVSTPRRENCGFFAFMPPPADHAAPYQQTVYYNCR